MNKLLIIAGPTSSGKTDLAISLAEKFWGEIVSGDSRHVYRGMDIGTGKDINKNSKFKTQNSKLKVINKNFQIGFRLKNGIPIWLVDIVAPDYLFNLSDYVRLAQRAIKDIWKRGKLPILVGGTGLYINALLAPFSDINIPPDLKLREELEDLDLLLLQEKLESINPDKWRKMNNSDRNNPRRLIRAIEIAKNKSKKFFEFLPADWLMIYLKSDLQFLYGRIDKRVDTRIKEGVIDEIKSLLDKGYSFDLPSFSAMPYRLFKSYFEGSNSEKSLSGIIKKWKFAEHALSRRQLTWFNKMAKDYKDKIFQADLTDKDYKQKIEKQVSKWYTLPS